MRMQIVNVVFWMPPHAIIHSLSCSWFSMIVHVSGLIRWTMWNTVRDFSILLLVPVQTFTVTATYNVALCLARQGWQIPPLRCKACVPCIEALQMRRIVPLQGSKLTYQSYD